MDEAWNSRDWETFIKWHAADVVVLTNGEPPTRGLEKHEKECRQICQAFPDNRYDTNYKTAFGQGDWTCTITDWTGTFKMPMVFPNGMTIPPTHKSFKVEFCSIVQWKDGKIVLERSYIDRADFMKQLGQVKSYFTTV
jgi:predicted ester cyclase